MKPATMDELSNALLLYLAVMLIWLIVASFPLVQIIRSPDTSLAARIFWSALVIIAPVIGLVIYLVYRHQRDRRV